jgi:UDP-N-acetylmuramyl pentapeptide phosphotransferase/UDP-N-acetylglucosamine-1-phosphate transferase
MQPFLNLALLPGILAAVSAFLATPLVIRLAKRLDIIDDPSKHKHPKVIHTYPVPRGGGLQSILNSCGGCSFCQSTSMFLEFYWGQQ